MLAPKSVIDRAVYASMEPATCVVSKRDHLSVNGEDESKAGNALCAAPHCHVHIYCTYCTYKAATSPTYKQ